MSILDPGYDRDSPIAKTLVAHTDILKAGSLVAQALEKLKAGTGKNEDGKLMLLKPVIKQADFLFKLKKQFDLLMACVHHLQKWNCQNHQNHQNKVNVMKRDKLHRNMKKKRQVVEVKMKFKLLKVKFNLLTEKFLDLKLVKRS